MTLPSVTIVVPTYARTSLLVEAIECFRRTVYDGDLRMLILNDCPLQTLICNVKNVQVWNAPLLTPFGVKLNTLFDKVSTELVIRCDDDDLFLPAFVRTVVAKLLSSPVPGEPLARLHDMLQWNGDAMRALPTSLHHGAVLRTQAWRNSCRFQPLDASSTDVDFWNVMSPRWVRGRHHHERDGHLLTIHRADAGRVHMEGTPTPPITEEHFHGAMDERIRSGDEPGNYVVLIPSWSLDWEALASAGSPTDSKVAYD